MTDIAHFNMVEQQVRTWNVHSSRLLEAMMNLDRRLFVPDDHQALCFYDTRISIDDNCRGESGIRMVGQRDFNPHVVRRLLKASRRKCE